MGGGGCEGTRHGGPILLIVILSVGSLVMQPLSSAVSSTVVCAGVSFLLVHNFPCLHSAFTSSCALLATLSRPPYTPPCKADSSNSCCVGMNHVVQLGPEHPCSAPSHRVRETELCSLCARHPQTSHSPLLRLSQLSTSILPPCTVLVLLGACTQNDCLHRPCPCFPVLHLRVVKRQVIVLHLRLLLTSL